MTYTERKTVVGYDGSRPAQAALEWAAADAARRGSELFVLHVAEWDDGWRAVLADALGRVRRVAPDLPVTLETALSGISRSLVATSGGAEMIVLGAPEPDSAQGVVLGSTTSAVVAKATCPVVLVSPSTAARTEPGAPITVGYDGSASAERALSFAAERAARREEPLIVVIAFSSLPPAGDAAEPGDEVEAERLGELAVDRIGRRFPSVEVRYELLEGAALPIRADASRGCDLVVVGNRGRGPIARGHGPLAVVH